MKLPRWRSPGPVSEWFRVSFDDLEIHLDVSGRKAWQASIAFATIERVGFKIEGPGLSDEIYLFTTVRPESYVVPTEANGGLELLEELGRRGLFPPEVQIEALSVPEGTITFWPPVRQREAGAAQRSAIDGCRAISHRSALGLSGTGRRRARPPRPP